MAEPRYSTVDREPDPAEVIYDELPEVGAADSWLGPVEIAERLNEQDAEIDRLRGDLRRWRKTFKHQHHAGTMKGLHIDTCAECGLDIRDGIHIRVGEDRKALAGEDE